MSKLTALEKLLWTKAAKESSDYSYVSKLWCGGFAETDALDNLCVPVKGSSVGSVAVKYFVFCWPGYIMDSFSYDPSDSLTIM